MKRPLMSHRRAALALACLLLLAPPLLADDDPAPPANGGVTEIPDGRGPTGPASTRQPPQAPRDWAPAVEAGPQPPPAAQPAPGEKTRQPTISPSEQPPSVAPAAPPAAPPAVAPAAPPPASPVPRPPTGLDDEAWLPGAPPNRLVPLPGAAAPEPARPPSAAPVPPGPVAPAVPNALDGETSSVRPSPPRWTPDRDVRIRILPDGRRVVVGPDGEPVTEEPVAAVPSTPPLDPAFPPVAPPGTPPVAPPPPTDDGWLPGAPPAGLPSTEPAAAPLPPTAVEDGWLPGAPPVAPPPVDPAPPAPPAASVAPPAPPAPPARLEEDHWLPGPAAQPPVAPPAVPEPAPAAPTPADDGWTGPERIAPVSPGAPGMPLPPPPAPEPAPPAAPGPPPTGDMHFPATPEADAPGHVRRLLAAPGDPRVPGYPAHVVRPADGSVALEPGHRPVVILFFDDGSRTSDQQAAEFLPVLVKYADRVDVVPIDVTDREAWTKAEQKLVRTYYMAKVPTTVVLAGDRRPVMLKFHRVAGAALEAALEKAVGR